jgi:hypothetical protein
MVGAVAKVPHPSSAKTMHSDLSRFERMKKVLSVNH